MIGTEIEEEVDEVQYTKKQMIEIRMINKCQLEIVKLFYRSS